MKLKSLLYLSTIVAGAAIAAPPVLADDVIEVVKVTAAKREQDIQQVPITINVISAKQLKAFDTYGLKDLAYQIPGLTVDRSTYDSYFLRGFGTAAGPNPGLSQSVSLYSDGIYNGRARELMAPLFDVSRVEVLRGSQGALLGKNTAAGAVSVVTNNPTDELEAGIKVDYLFDRSKGYDIDGYVSGPITDTLGARAAIKIYSKGGWLYNIANNQDDPERESQSARLTLAYAPREGIQNVFKYTYDYFTGEGAGSKAVASTVLRKQVSGWDRNSPGIVGVLNSLTRYNAHHVGNTLTMDIDDMTLVAVTGYSAFTSRAVALGRNLPPESITTDYTDNFDQFAQEVRLLSPVGQTVEWIAGLYFDTDHYDVKNVFSYYNASGFTGVLTSNFRSSANTYSAYVTATWNVTEDLRLIGGMRGTQISRKGVYELRATSGQVFPGSFPAGTTPPYRALPNTHINESSFDPSLTVQYNVMQDVMVFASYSRGSKGGAFQAASRSATAANFSLRPETSENFELGVKSKLWEFLTFNVSGFYQTMRNMQVSQNIVPPGSPPGTPSSLTSANAAKAESQGVEVILDADLNDWVEGLRFDFNGAFIDAKYTDFPGATCTFAATAAGCASGFMNPPTNTIPFNGAGVRISNTPEWSGTMGLHYTRMVTDGLKFSGVTTANMRSKSWVDFGNQNPRVGLQPGYTKLNLNLTIGSPDDSWTLSFIGTNLNDVYSTDSGFVSGVLNSYSIEEGRRLSVQATFRY